ncbi:hypothetical protein P280DRAFT_191612 [Massarina eburnea CBS 473.64]|uniref:Rhodopsin domain-containing protein n=1 Tax=Massarina eburnea CBS 473.64 TaxID=1395130 RepID=A0A6A6RKB7_9PLEO|nr:hypothetical protein P280DRAFT_191612 [Massarina eburnea CBS 473.64]
MRIPSSALSARATNTPDGSKRDAVTVTTWVTLVLLVVVFLLREVIKYTVKRKLEIDDLLTVIATIFAIGLSITTLILASDGLGDVVPLTVRRANDIMKAYYASNFLYIATLGFAKLALVDFFYKIHKVQQTHRRLIFWFGIFIFAWTFACLVAVAFQCGLPHPWEVLTLHCYDSGTFWIVYCITDMTIDVSIIMLSVNLVFYLNVKTSKKIAVVACFTPRIFVIGASLTRLVYLYPITPHTSPAFNLWLPVICTQVQVSLSIVTACIPYMRPFFDGTESEGRKGDGSRRNMITADEENGRFSSRDYLRGHKRGNGLSEDSTASNSWKYVRTPDVSPRLPSPPPLSPLTPPRLMTPPNCNTTPTNNSRSPSERGLRLKIPNPDIYVQRASIVSPQTASSNALSPECLSPQPLLSGSPSYSPVPLTPQEPTPPPRSHTPPSNTYDSDSEPPVRSPTQRFSLFPTQRAPRYSLVPQAYPKPPVSIHTTISERSRLSSRSHTPAMSVSRTNATSLNATPETRTPSSSQTPSPKPPNTRNTSPSPLLPLLFPVGKTSPRTRSPSFANVAYDDPLRTRAPPATALTSSIPVPAPILAPAPTLYSTSAYSSLPSHYPRTPRTTHASIRTSQQAIPSYHNHNHNYNHSYATTPPTSNPPTFPLPQPPTFTPYTPPISTTHSSPYSNSQSYASQPPSFSPISQSTTSPTSPQRRRNRRILTPHNSSRTVADSPISPVSPPTPVQFWREDAFGNGPGRTVVPGLWEEQRLAAVVVGERPVMRRDLRSSPRIVVQRFE